MLVLTLFVIFICESGKNEIVLTNIGRTTVRNNVTGIDVDRSTGNLYWIDKTKSSILVAGTNYNGEDNATVLKLGDGQQPFDLTVDSKHGQIYWTDADNGCVYGATLAGQNVRLVAESLIFPAGIAIDDTDLYVMQLGKENGTLVKMDLTCIASGIAADNCTTQYRLSRDTMPPHSRYSYITAHNGTVYIPSIQGKKILLTKMERSGNITTETLVEQHDGDIRDEDIPRIAVTSYTREPKIENLCFLAVCQHHCVPSIDQTTGNLTAVCLSKEDSLPPNLTLRSKRSPFNQTNTTRDCVSVGGNTYCNVTRFWEPRISETGVWLAVVIPTLFAAVALVVLTIKTVNVGNMKDVYYLNVVPVYFKYYCGDELYTLITETPAPDHEHYAIFNKPSDCFFRVWCEGGKVRVRGTYSSGDDVGDEATFNLHENRRFGGDRVYVSGKTLKHAREVCTCINLPKIVKYLSVVVAIFCVPVVKVVWDVVDVSADCYYFGQIESGKLISGNITRDTYVNNSILAFAVLGCLKSTIFAWVYYKIVYSSEDAMADCTSSTDISKAVFLKPLAVCIKILLEDGVELILEYFYVDKFITTNQPWLLIAKDIITATLYIMPIITILRSWRKNCTKIVSGVGYKGRLRFGKVKISVSKWLHVYLTCVLIHATFSVVCMTRVAGMVAQYTGTTIGRDCLSVVDGQLVQTPFDSGCLNGYDQVILTCMGVIAALFLVILFFVVLHGFSDTASKSICEKLGGALGVYDKVCDRVASQFELPGELNFNIDGHVTTKSRESRKDKLTYLGYHKVSDHFAESAV